MENIFERTEKLIGESGVNKLSQANVIVFGVGGVGGYVVEALVRSGIQNISIVDNDKVAPSNINRQIIALNSTIGENKCDIMEKRIKDINPNCNVTKYQMFYLPENSDMIDLTKYDYVIDCIDTITAKLDIISKCYFNDIKIISCMGMGNKLNPLDIRIADINKTTVCPLARTIRYELRKRNVKKLKVCYSLEEPIKLENDKRTPGSIAFVPSVAGLVIASEVIKDLIK